jgi:hypothetical protein
VLCSIFVDANDSVCQFGRMGCETKAD